MSRPRLRRSGQSTVEFMLAISVVVIGVAAAAYVFIGPLQEGMEALDDDTRILLDDERPASQPGRR
ncbi:MAG: hypothetical protein VX899_08745 [Myxococcota bacterium]|nr:hypothetical protein [Myxococcota bacterium]